MVSALATRLADASEPSHNKDSHYVGSTNIVQLISIGGTQNASRSEFSALLLSLSPSGHEYGR